MMLLDRNVRIVEEGIDVAVRIGALSDHSGIVRGGPALPADLADHRCIAGSGVRAGSVWPFGAKGETVANVVPRLTVNTVDATLAAAEAGLGIANLLSYQTESAIAAGRLVRVLADHAPLPLPVSLLFEGGRAAMPAVRLFIEAMKERGQELTAQR